MFHTILNGLATVDGRRIAESMVRRLTGGLMLRGMGRWRKIESKSVLAVSSRGRSVSNTALS